MRLLFFAIFLMITGRLFAQVTITNHKEVNPIDKRSYSFPIVHMKSKPAIAAKINRILQSEVLDLEGKPKKSLFENVWTTPEMHIPMASDFEYRVLRNETKLLTLQIDFEGCGAYCESDRVHFNFDLLQGTRINLQKLINKKGLDLMTDSIHQQLNRAFDQQIRLAEDSIKKYTTEKNPEQVEYYISMKNIYSNCFWRNGKPDYGTQDFILQLSGLTLVLERCSNHANRNADELDHPMTAYFSFRQLQPYFTPYAKKLLLAKR